MRTPEQQAGLDERTKNLALYHYDSCWFCGRVRTVIGGLGLNIEMRDVMRNPDHHQTLIAEGGSATVPCLRIDNGDGTIEWMYESAIICDYLNAEFSS